MNKENEPIGDDRLLTVLDAATIAGVGRRRIDLAVFNREVPVVVLGPKTKRIRLSDLRKWIAANTQKAVAR